MGGKIEVFGAAQPGNEVGGNHLFEIEKVGVDVEEKDLTDDVA